jgi:hypothetical protein
MYQALPVTCYYYNSKSVNQGYGERAVYKERLIMKHPEEYWVSDSKGEASVDARCSGRLGKVRIIQNGGQSTWKEWWQEVTRGAEADDNDDDLFHT